MSRADDRKPPAVRGDIAAALRVARGQSLTQVSADTGVHITTLSLIENGHRPGRPHLDRLAIYYGVAPEVLAGHAPVLRALRELAQLTFTDVVADLGCNPRQLRRWEAGQDPLTATAVAGFARLLAVPESVLVLTPLARAAA